VGAAGDTANNFGHMTATGRTGRTAAVAAGTDSNRSTATSLATGNSAAAAADRSLSCIITSRTASCMTARPVRCDSSHPSYSLGKTSHLAIPERQAAY